MDSDMEDDAPELMHIENMTLTQLQREALHMSCVMVTYIRKPETCTDSSDGVIGRDYMVCLA